LKISLEIRTAILVLTGIVLFVFGFNYLKSNDLLVRDGIYYANYDNTEGLVVGTPVTINGFQVGSVENISLLPSNTHLLVRFRVDRQYNFSKNSIAKIYESGLIGGKSLAVVPALDGAEFAQSGDTLQSSIAPGLTQLVNDKLSPLQEKIESMVNHADSVLIAFKNVFDTSAQAQLNQSITHLASALSAIDNISQQIDQSLQSESGGLGQTINNLNDITNDLKQTTATLSEADISGLIDNLHQSTSNLSLITTQIQSGEGTLGQLVANDSLYNALHQTNISLQLLLDDLRLNPKRYVQFSLFGKKQVPYESTDEGE
jgi:phospholipid/cholesterol/gamma-HCH transport system substrate-binding protein